MRIVGIDPGRYGAIAHVDLDRMAVLDLMDMPLELGKTGKTEPDPRAIFTALRTMRPDLIIIEHVQPMGRSGAPALWTFAEGFGALVAAAKISCGSDRRVTLVRPAAWKEALNLSDSKAESLAMAREVFPEASDMLTRAKDDGRAEALLLTEYHRRFVAPLASVEVF